MIKTHFSSTWMQLPLRSLCSHISSGGTPSRKIQSYFVKDGHLWVKSKELLDGSIYTTEETISDEAIRNSSAKIYSENTVLLAMYGANVGQLAILRRKAAVNQAICAMVVNENVADYRFLFYALLYRRKGLISKAFGVAQQNLNQDLIKSFNIPCPPLSTQRKIAAILSAYDDLIENNTRRIAILEEMARALYREWFVHFRFPGHEKIAMVESTLGMIPEGWEVVKLGDVCAITMGQSPSSQFYNTGGEGLPFHQGVADFGSRFPEDRVYCTVENRIAEVGDILFSVRAPVGRINIANKKIVIGRGLSAIRSKNGNQAFILQQLKELFQEEDSMGNGAIFKSVTKDDMHGIKMIQPSLEIISAYELHAQPIFSMLEVLTNKNSNLRQTRDLLLPKLMAGEIDVEGMEVVAEAIAETA